ncbi:MAG: hypothetical protein GC203_02730 [Phenylobacterium sp.]|uniref:hypothetical protein n=1 Tax=Phenylobacterium sp. TaxID=1871053 RepID=UPI0025ED69C0|nr:hypothetical protein [Phenylobacterium sp.]MBI1196756.1 hypothetical protein [Phenylobacterium sp.]
MLVAGTPDEYDISAASSNGTFFQGINGAGLPQTNIPAVGDPGRGAFTTNAWVPVPTTLGAGTSGLETLANGTMISFTITARLWVGHGDLDAGDNFRGM